MAVTRRRLLRVVAEHGVVRRQDRATAVAEDDVHALVDQDLHDDLGSGHDLAGARMRGGTDGGVTALHGDAGLVTSWTCCVAMQRSLTA